MKIWQRYGWALSILLGFLTPFMIVTLLWLDGIVPFGLGIGIVLGGPRFTGLAISICIAALILVVMLVRWIPRRRGGLGVAAAALFCLGCFLAILPANLVGYHTKFLGAEYLARRSEPVVVAIESFIAREGAPPKAISDLVPNDLPAVPTTGSVLYPNYTLLTGAAANLGNPWILQIEMFDLMKWDALFYCPNQNCTHIGGGGRVPMGRWVFLDE